MLRAASILGSSFIVSDLSVTTAQPAFDLSLALAEALTAQVVEGDVTASASATTSSGTRSTRICRSASAAGCTVRRRSGWRGRRAGASGGAAVQPRGSPGRCDRHRVDHPGGTDGRHDIAIGRRDVARPGPRAVDRRAVRDRLRLERASCLLLSGGSPSRSRRAGSCSRPVTTPGWRYRRGSVLPTR